MLQLETVTGRQKIYLTCYADKPSYVFHWYFATKLSSARWQRYSRTLNAGQHKTFRISRKIKLPSSTATLDHTLYMWIVWLCNGELILWDELSCEIYTFLKVELYFKARHFHRLDYWNSSISRLKWVQNDPIARINVGNVHDAMQTMDILKLNISCFFGFKYQFHLVTTLCLWFDFCQKNKKNLVMLP